MHFYSFHDVFFIRSDVIYYQQIFLLLFYANFYTIIKWIVGCGAKWAFFIFLTFIRTILSKNKKANIFCGTTLSTLYYISCVNKDISILILQSFLKDWNKYWIAVSSTYPFDSLTYRHFIHYLWYIHYLSKFWWL